MNQFQEIWNEVEELLKEARSYLDIDQSSLSELDDSEFLEYLKHNELELALDELEAISDSFEPPKKFWQCLIKSANLMGLKEHAKRYVELCSHY